jgi:hypothetical protein
MSCARGCCSNVIMSMCSRMSCSRMLADALVDSAFYLDVNCRFALLYIALEEVDYGWKVGVMK